MCTCVVHEPGGTDQSAGISGCFVCGLRNAARRCSICRGGNVAGYSGCEHDRAGNDRSFVLFHGTDRRIFSKTAVIYADKEAAREEQIRQLPIYCKKQVPWAVVETLDIAKPGEKICIKTLENDTGLIIHADADLLIMIGCLGEVYEITRQKFENSYEKSDEQLDIFSQLLDFIPAVELPRTGEYKTIDELAYLCVPKPGGIYAKQLQVRTKVFGKGRGDYFIGKAGDYLAIRLDDLQDMYIIRREVFERTYELKTGE